MSKNPQKHSKKEFTKQKLSTAPDAILQRRFIHFAFSSLVLPNPNPRLPQLDARQQIRDQLRPLPSDDPRRDPEKDQKARNPGKAEQNRAAALGAGLAGRFERVPRYADPVGRGAPVLAGLGPGIAAKYPPRSVKGENGRVQRIIGYLFDFAKSACGLLVQGQPGGQQQR